MTEILDYFDGDELAADVWPSKYQVKKDNGEAIEKTPDDMHRRLAKEFARIEYKYLESEKATEGLSEFGYNLIKDREEKDIEKEIFDYFRHFKWIVPQGSIMSILGHPYKVGSLSNCFVIPSPYDSYGGIMKTDEQLVQLMKRRAGVGTNLNGLRPEGTLVHNAAGTSTGASSFMSRYSNSTREVAQDGRRGALMLLLSVKHPSIFRFITAKKDRTQVTGANISAMLTNEFLLAAEKDDDYICSFPVERNYAILSEDPYNTLLQATDGVYMKIHAKELFELIIEMAWENAEPGIAFIDRVINFSPDGVYELFKAIASNPCGEQWLPAYDSCRLFAMNLFSIVLNPFAKDARIDFDKLYEISYMQQRLADDLVDLELEHITAILDKIKNDPEPDDVKRTERELWENVYKITSAGRRTGCGITALGDMLAALNLKYDSDEALTVIEQVFRIKMQAELDCTIDMAILRGSFEGWANHLEFFINEDGTPATGWNDFYDMLLKEFPEQTQRMCNYGRRNVSFSTVAPTGTLSIMTQTTSGIEPLFLAWYMRRKKINPSDKDSRVDFVDQNGDKWQEFAVLHPKFKEWIFSNFSKDTYGSKIEGYGKDVLEAFFKKSPWYGSTANDISWKRRVEIQAIIQKYTTNAISSTINLPSTATKEDVSEIYWNAWRLGLKGVTVYRDGCRTGVLVNTDANTKEVAFSPKDAAKRPDTLQCSINHIKVKGNPYTVIVGTLFDKPYEVFAMEGVYGEGFDEGTMTKKGKGKYNLSYGEGKEAHIETNITSEMTDEQAALTRLISTSLRHGTDVKYIIEQLSKTHGSIVSFTKAIIRCLKRYVEEGAKSGVTCNECGSGNVIYEEGCSKCKDCGSSKCG